MFSFLSITRCRLQPSLIVLSVFLKRRRYPPHRLRRMSLAPSRLDRARSMPLHILRIRCWGFGPKDYIPTFAFFSPWEARHLLCTTRANLALAFAAGPAAWRYSPCSFRIEEYAIQPP